MTTTFSPEGLRQALQVHFDRPIALPELQKIINEAATRSGTAASITVTEGPCGPFYYNVVFISTDHSPAHSPLFITVEMDTRIDYGSDLLMLREHLKKMLGYKNLVIQTYTQLAGPTRPNGVTPKVELAQNEPHQKPV